MTKEEYLQNKKAYQKRVKDSKTRRNNAERSFMHYAREAGLEFTTKGYPDFICWTPSGKLFLVEVKPRAKILLSRDQHRLMNHLRRFGIKCYKWSPDKNWLAGQNYLKKETGGRSK